MAENAIISDLEFAPQLTDDMVLAVEDTKNTYSATLGQLRGQLNKVFVEVKDVDFDTLVDDGFYQASGTLNNAPFVGSVVWLVQVVKEGSTIVQTASSNDLDNFLNIYRRRWNGTSWGNWTVIAGSILPVGSLIPQASGIVHSGFLRCDGSAVSRITYANLFAVIGTIYGAGDRVNTFNLPNFINRTFWGGTTSGAYLDGTLPNITGVTGPNGSYDNHYEGCFYDAGGRYSSTNGSNRYPHGVGFDASLSSSKYQDGALVRPESVQVMILIKY